MILGATLLALPLAVLAWLWLVSLQLTASGVASTERACQGRATLKLWPVTCVWIHEPALRELRVVLFGLTVWRGPPPVGGRGADAAERTGRDWKLPRLPSRAVSSEVARFIRAQLHRIELSLLEGDLRFGFEEPDYTGRCLGVLYALDGAWPRETQNLNVAPQWSASTQGDASGRLQLRVWVGRMLLSGFGLGLRLWRLTRRKAGAASETRQAPDFEAARG